MTEICGKCGNNAVTDSAGMCFHCADVEGEKYLVKKKVIPKDTFAIMSALDLLVSGIFFVKFEPRIIFTIIYFCSLAVIISFYLEKRYHFVTPLLDTIAKVCLLLWCNENGAAFFDEATKLSFIGVLWVYIGRPAVVILILFLLYSICHYVSVLFINKNRDNYIEMNKVLDNEAKLSKDLAQIPQYLGGYTQEQYDQYFYEELNRAIELVDELDIDDEDKQKTINMLRSRGEVKSDVGGKFGYLNIIKLLLEVSFRTSDKGKFINEITYDRDNGILPIVDSAPVSGYVTEKYFNMYNRVEKEINEPYNYFLNRSYELEINEWFKSFRNEFKTIKSGYVGEGRVAKSLKKYEGQAIVLPNIRIEVDGESSEMDYIVISPYGVYSLEVKNLAEKGAYDILIEKDGRWNKVTKGVKKPMKSPDTQNERHIVHLETMINRALGRSLDDYIRVKGMIVIANDQVTIKNYNDDCIVKRYDYVMQAIRQNDIVLKESEMKQIAAAIKDAELEHIPYSLEFEGNYFNTYFAIKMLMNEYMYWKEGNQELFDYVNEYKNNVINPTVSQQEY